MAFTNIPGGKFVNGLLRQWLGEHAHTGTDGSATVSVGSVTDGTVTNNKLATDVKVGSLATLTTTEKASVVGALNEVDGVADGAASNATSALNNIGTLASLTTTAKNNIVAAVNEVDGVADGAASAVLLKYTKPGTGIPAADLAAAVQTSLGKADTALQPSGGTNVIYKQIALGGYAASPTQVKFQGADVAATILGTQNTATYALSVGNTFIVNPNGAGDQTWTVAGTQAKSVSGASPTTDTTTEADTKLNISVDGSAATEVTFDWTAGGGTNSGIKIAAEMQTKIQALGGAFAAVTVDYNVTTPNKYTVLSGTYGTASSVVITPATSGSITEELKLGTAGGGTETAGTGDAANLAAATAAECAAKIAALNGLTAVVEPATTGKIRITSDTAGAASSLVVNAACTLDTVFGITGSDYGEEGLGLSSDMSSTSYAVMVQTVKGSAVTDTYTVGDKATTGFNIRPETNTSTETVDLIIFGTLA